MIDHVYMSVTDIDRSLAFYSEALKPLGWSPVGHYDSASGPKGVPDLSGIGDDAFGSRKAVGVFRSMFIVRKGLVAGAEYVPNRQFLSIPFRSELIHGPA